MGLDQFHADDAPTVEANGRRYRYGKIDEHVYMLMGEPKPAKPSFAIQAVENLNDCRTFETEADLRRFVDGLKAGTLRSVRGLLKEYAP